MKPRTLIVIPGTVNYFYNLSGRRIAESLGELGIEAVVHPLNACPHEDFDLCLLSNISEIIASVGDETIGVEQIRKLKKRSRKLVTLAMECVSTNWYEYNWNLSATVEAEVFLDLGLNDQSRYLRTSEQKKCYRYVVSGLTSSEKRQIEQLDYDDANRTIPWSFVGSGTPFRAALADFLLREVDPRGFVYLPELSPCKEKGSPHLNQQQYEQVLRRSRYQVWCSHHHNLYVEAERLRTSLLTGSVPIKIVGQRDDICSEWPFRYLMAAPEDLATQILSRDFAELRERFRRDWENLPSLASELARILDENQLCRLPANQRAA